MKYVKTKANFQQETRQFLASWIEKLPFELYQQYHQNWLMENEKSYFGFVPNGASALILGTFPVLELSSSGFFYHSPANCFWKILEELSDVDLSSLEAKLKWLSATGIGISDILHTVKRTDELSSSLDNNLKVVKYNDIHNLLANNPKITDIFLTSGGPKSKSLSGKSAAGWLGDHFRKSSKSSIKRLTSNGATLEVSLKPNARKLTLHYLITPAPQDKQLGRYLRENNQANTMIGKVDFLKGALNLKETYKVLQWGKYLSLVPGVLSDRVKAELEQIDFKTILMEEE